MSTPSKQLSVAGASTTPPPERDAAAARGSLGSGLPRNADEPSAAEQLEREHASTEWERRASWLEREAQIHTDPAARARLMIAASEIRAMCGARLEARRLAQLAATERRAPAFARRQARALSHGDITAVVDDLGEEARTSARPALAAHAHYMAAETARLLQDEASLAERQLEAAEHIEPNDFRAPLQRIIHALGRNGKIPDVRLRPDEVLRPLRQALGQLAQLRGAQAPRVGPAELSALPVVEATRAWARGEPHEAATALDALSTWPGVRGAIQWITAFWRAAASADETALLTELANLVRQSPARAERRALAARALAHGELELVLEAMAADAHAGEPAKGDAGEAFSAVERLSLGALIGQPVTSEALGVRRPAEDIALWPLSSAVARLAEPAGNGGATRADADLLLGRAAGGWTRFAEYAGSETDESFCRLLLRLERSLEAGDLAQIARDLPRFAATAPARAECSFLAGVCCELMERAEEACELYRLSLPSATTREAAVRALSTRLSDGAALLRSLAAHATDPTLRAWLLLETLLWLPFDAPEMDAIAEEVLRIDPRQLAAAHVAELAARMRGDRSRVARWLARQRQGCTGPEDNALATLRQVLFLMPTDRRAAGEHVAELPAAELQRPGVRRLRERLVEEGWSERAAARLRCREGRGPRARQALTWEAAALYLRAEQVDTAVSTARELSPELALPFVERFASAPPDLQWLLEAITARLQSAQSTELTLELYEQAASLELRRGQHERAAAWQKKVLETRPGSLAALRALEVWAMHQGRTRELESVGGELMKVLSGPALLGRCFVAARLAIDRGAFTESAIPAAIAASVPSPPLWALRLAAEHARATDDDEQALRLQGELRQRREYPLDQTALALRMAEAEVRVGHPERALQQLESVRTVAGDHVVWLWLRAELSSIRSDPYETARALEALAAAVQSRAMRVETWFRAACVWLDAASERERGVFALRQAAAVGLPHTGVVARLSELYGGAPEALGQVEIDAGPPEPRLRELTTRAGELADAGRPREARVLLDAVLAADAVNPEASMLSATLHLREREWTAAERALWRVARASHDDALALDALERLSALYENQLSNPERCREVYEKILERRPLDLTTRRRLVQVLSAAKDFATAALHQRELVERAGGDDERRQSLLALVDLLDATVDGASEAEELLAQALRTWPESSPVLRAAVLHHRRVGDVAAARALLQRAIDSCRGAIQAGRIELDVFRVLGLAARLDGDAGLARSAHAALAALQGKSEPRDGAGATAQHDRFDDLLAPAPMSPALRHFLYTAGAALERAFGTDLRYFEASPLAEPSATDLQASAFALGAPELRIMVSEPLGFDCICCYADAPYLVMGRSLLAQPNARVRDFFLARAIKLARVNATALSRMPPSDVWAAVAGFLACFAPPWPAEGASAQRLISHRNKIRPHVTASFGPELNELAAAVTANAVPQAEHIGDALWRWASRVALLATGDLGAALEAAWISSQPPGVTPNEVALRLRWIATHPLARDLVGFSVSEAYTEARRRAGLDGAAH